MAFLNDCGMSDICNAEEMVVVDTGVFSFDMPGPRKPHLTNTSKEVAYLSTLVEIARSTDSLYVPSNISKTHLVCLPLILMF